MTNQFFLVFGAMLGANLFTLMFVWGAYHAFRTPDDDLKLAHIIAMLVPIGMAGISAYLYG